MPIREMKGERHSPLPTQSAFIAFQNAIVLLLMLWQVLQVVFFFSAARSDYRKKSTVNTAVSQGLFLLFLIYF